MTTKALGARNRKTRIEQAVRAGEKYKEIATRENVGSHYVSQVARKMGIRKVPR